MVELTFVAFALTLLAEEDTTVRAMVGTTVLALVRIAIPAELGLAAPGKYQVMAIRQQLVVVGTGPSMEDLT